MKQDAEKRSAEMDARLNALGADIEKFRTQSAAEMQQVRDSVREYAADGRFELYKLSLKFDNPEARRAHEFPLDMQQVEVKEMLRETENTGRPYPTLGQSR